MMELPMAIAVIVLFGTIGLLVADYVSCGRRIKRRHQRNHRDDREVSNERDSHNDSTMV